MSEEFNIELMRARCYCGQHKPPGVSLCVPCLEQLPGELRDTLGKIGEFHGRQAALDRAMQVLRPRQMSLSTNGHR